MSEQQPYNFFKMKNIPAIVSGLGALAIVLSVAYDFAYFWMFDLSLAELPTSLADHFRSSLILFPWTVAIISFAIVCQLFVERFLHGMEAEGGTNSSQKLKDFHRLEEDNPEKAKISRLVRPYILVVFRETPFVVFRIFGYVFSFYIFFLWQTGKGTSYSVIFYLFVLIFSHIFVYLILHPGIIYKMSERIVNLSYWAVIALIVIILAAFSDATNVKKVTHGEHIFHLKGVRIEKGTLVRAFEKYFVLWVKEEKAVKIINAANVISFQPQQPASDEEAAPSPKPK